MSSSKYSLNCCTCLIWFEFEWKTLEKINTKAIRNSLKNRKANSAQVGPLSSAPPRALCAWQAGPASRRQPTRPLSLSLSLSLHRGPGLSAPCLSHARRSLSVPPTPPVSSSPTSRPRSPAVDVPTTAWSSTTSARPRPFWAPRPAHPPSPAHLRPQPNPLTLSLALHARPESSATAHRRLSSVLRSSSSPRPVRCLGELRLAVSYSGHPLVCPSPL
jgi:hypothetical protein